MERSSALSSRCSARGSASSCTVGAGFCARYFREAKKNSAAAHGLAFFKRPQRLCACAKQQSTKKLILGCKGKRGRRDDASRAMPTAANATAAALSVAAGRHGCQRKWVLVDKPHCDKGTASCHWPEKEPLGSRWTIVGTKVVTNG